MRVDGAASLTPGTPRLRKGVPVPGCVPQAVLVLHLVQLGLRGLQSPAESHLGLSLAGAAQAVLVLHPVQLGLGCPQSHGSSGALSWCTVPLLLRAMHAHQALPHDTSCL